MKCAVCDQVKDAKLCSGCQSVAYCSAAHQKSDWRKHKKNCLSYKVISDEDSSSGSAHVIATRDLAESSRILDEHPLCQVPDFNCQHGKELEAISLYERDAAFCLVCGQRMGGYNRLPISPCSTCGFPMCPECEKLPIHADNECRVLAKKRIKFKGMCRKNDPCILKIIMKIRLSNLKTKQPDVWKEMLKLYNVYCSKHENYQPDEGDEDAQVQKLLDIVKTKGFLRCYNIDFCHRLDFIRSPFNYGSILYKKASSFKHSCKPNCTWTLGPYPKYTIRIRAAVPIKAGEKLTISYFQSTSILPGTQERRRILKEHFGFTCMCVLCVDPTEAGTYMSAQICSSCTGDGPGRRSCPRFEGEYLAEDFQDLGFLLPEDLTDGEGENARWKCNKCSAVVLYSSLEPFIREMQTKAATLVHSPEMLKRNFYDGCLDKPFKVLARKLYLRPFHPNHWIIQAINFNIIDLVYTLKRAVVGLSERADMEDLVKRSKYLMNIHDKIYPGLSCTAVHINNLASCAIFLLCNPLDEIVESINNSGDAKKFIEFAQIYQEYQNRVYTHRQANFLFPPDGKTEAEWSNLLDEKMKLAKTFSDWESVVKKKFHL